MKRPKLNGKFVICIRNEECEDLEPRKLYQVLPDEVAEADGYIRVIDESGEDYPRNYFLSIELPKAAEKALLSAAWLRAMLTAWPSDVRWRLCPTIGAS